MVSVTPCHQHHHQLPVGWVHQERLGRGGKKVPRGNASTLTSTMQRLMACTANSCLQQQRRQSGDKLNRYQHTAVCSQRAGTMRAEQCSKLHYNCQLTCPPSCPAATRAGQCGAEDTVLSCQQIISTGHNPLLIYTGYQRGVPVKATNCINTVTNSTS
jgi:hypothetical protein